VLKMPADFWLGLQQDWDLWHVMRMPEARAIEAPRPLAPLDIGRQAPILLEPPAPCPLGTRLSRPSVATHGRQGFPASDNDSSHR
jgi:hypothetical protein